MRTRVIINPSSGSAGDMAAVQEAIERKLPGAEVAVTGDKGEAEILARDAVAHQFDLVIAGGGDGTVNEVVNGLSCDFTKARLGVLPLGTGNDFARTIRVPDDLEAALDVLAADHVQEVDVIRVTSPDVRYFINVSAGGFSGLVGEKLTEEMKKTWGPLAYLKSALEALPDLTNYQTEIILDEREHIDLKAYNIVVANARYVAGGKLIAPDALIDDGLADLVVVPESSIPQLAMLAPMMLMGKHLTSDLVVFRRAQKIEIRSKPGMWFNVDGELVGNDPATFEVVRRALRVVVGPEE